MNDLNLPLICLLSCAFGAGAIVMVILAWHAFFRNFGVIDQAQADLQALKWKIGGRPDWLE